MSGKAGLSVPSISLWKRQFQEVDTNRGRDSVIVFSLSLLFLFFWDAVDRQNVKTCPNDRRPFETVLVRLDIDGPVVRTVAVVREAQVDAANIEEPFEVTRCEVLGFKRLNVVLLGFT